MNEREKLIDRIAFFDNCKDPVFNSEYIGLALGCDYTDKRILVEDFDFNSVDTRLLEKVVTYIDAAIAADVAADAMFEREMFREKHFKVEAFVTHSGQTANAVIVTAESPTGAWAAEWPPEYNAAIALLNDSGDKVPVTAEHLVDIADYLDAEISSSFSLDTMAYEHEVLPYRSAVAAMKGKEQKMIFKTVYVTCPGCDGTGKCSPDCTGDGRCYCDGRGCPTCDGHGEVVEYVEEARDENAA